MCQLQKVYDRSPRVASEKSPTTYFGFTLIDENYSFTSILPVFAPLNKPRKASKVLSSPSITVSLLVTWPLAIIGPMAA